MQHIIIYTFIFLIFLLLLTVFISSEYWSKNLEDNEKIINNTLDAMDGSQINQLNNEWERFLDLNEDRVRDVINLIKTNQDYRSKLSCLINYNKLAQLNIDRLMVLINENLKY